MRAALILVLLYILFLVQASATRLSPDLVLLTLVAVSLRENRLLSTLAGAFAGLCLDLTSPAFVGANLLVYALAGYGVASLGTLLHHSRWATWLFVLAALVLKWAGSALLGPGLPGLIPLAVSSGLTLLLAPLAEFGLTRLLYPGWQRA
jgi:rod shape-determining protein MreD